MTPDSRLDKVAGLQGPIARWHILQFCYFAQSDFYRVFFLTGPPLKSLSI